MGEQANKVLLPIERINKVAHLLPVTALQDVNARMGDWVLSGGKHDDPYMEQQALYAERIANLVRGGQTV